MFVPEPSTLKYHAFMLSEKKRMMPASKFNLLPPEIFDHIMFLLGCDSNESLETCRQVCREWNQKIMNSLWEKPTKKWGAIIGRRFEKSWDDENLSLPAPFLQTEEKIYKALELENCGILHSDVIEKLADRCWFNEFSRSFPTPRQVACAGILAHKGLLKPVEWMSLRDVNLASIPAEHMGSLVSYVTERVDIFPDGICDLVTILDSVNISSMFIGRRTLNNDETQALVRALETRVKIVRLEFKLTAEVFTMYSGLGKCRSVRCWFDGRYDDATDAFTGGMLREWASDKDWTVTEGHMCNTFEMLRN